MSDQNQLPQVPSQVQTATSGAPMIEDDSRQNDRVGVMSQVIPQVVEEASQADVPFSAPAGAKEQSPVQVVESAEIPSAVQSVEHLRTPEIPIEVEKYIQEVSDPQQQLSQDINQIAQQAPPTSILPQSKTVIVLPLTEQGMREAKKEPLTSSKRWLAEWSEWVRKKLFDEVVYKDSVA